MPTTEADVQAREWERTQAEMFGMDERVIEDRYPTLFTDEEWDVMLNDPSFGYVCSQGHRLSDGDRNYGACGRCESEAEADYADYMDSHPDEFQDWDMSPDSVISANPIDEPF